MAFHGDDAYALPSAVFGSMNQNLYPAFSSARYWATVWSIKALYAALTAGSFGVWVIAS